MMASVSVQVRARLQRMGPFQPMNIFLRQELDRMQRIIGRVRTTLTDLKLAIDGTIIMSEDLRDALDNLYDARIPKLWQKVSWESATLGFWFTELLERNQQFHTWIFEGRPNQFWMTGFFNPQGFLTAMRQETTRMNVSKGWALDSVVLYNDVTKMMKEDVTCSPPADIGGVYVYGLFLDGAGWDKKNTKLMESSPKVLFTLLPVVHVYAISTTSPADSKKQQGNLYSCPVYKKPRRTDLTFIFSLYLRTAQDADHWTLRVQPREIALGSDSIDDVTSGAVVIDDVTSGAEDITSGTMDDVTFGPENVASRFSPDDITSCPGL
ncbi:DYH8 protein, partial [Polypterus senegalus]